MSKLKKRRLSSKIRMHEIAKPTGTEIKNCEINVSHQSCGTWHSTILLINSLLFSPPPPTGQRFALIYI